MRCMADVGEVSIHRCIPMRYRTILATAFLAVSATAGLTTAASAQSGCRRGDGLGSNNASSGINANEPSRAIMNPCSTMYRNGANVRRMEKRRHPDAVVRH